MGPGTLAKILDRLPPMVSDNLMIGLDTYDDAGVYRLDESRALIQTIDFFTPIVDDPYTFGQIAAANALSDVYAMGGVPLTAMNVVCFPSRKLGPEVLGEILRGGAEKVLEAGAVVIGGHSIEDAEPKYGLAVTGLAHPEHLMTNAQALPGQVLVLTKPLGTGIVSTGLKAGMASPLAVKAMLDSMVTLNRDAANLAKEMGVRGCTDVTGFGLLGHAAEMALASGVAIHFWVNQFRFLPEAPELAASGLVPAGAYANRDFLGDRVSFAEEVKEAERDLLFDPQTSGGLLIALDGPLAGKYLTLAEQKGIEAAVVGEVVMGAPGSVVVGRG